MKCKFLLLTVFFFLLILSAKQSIAQSYPIGNLDSFVIFTGSGNINNTNITSTKSTFVLGDVGTQSGTITSVKGAIKTTVYTATSLTAQTLKDLDTLYKQVTSITTSTQASSTLANTTITPGIYEFSSLGNISGSIVLDAQGNNQKKFIFIYDNGLTIAPATIMSLVNNAYANNVFWIIKSGNLIIGNTVTMLGNAISDAGNITMDAGSLSGRLASITGSISITTIKASTPIATPLPVKFSSLTGQCDNNHMVLRFSTESEQDNSYFTVQQSSDAVNWTSKGKIMGAGNSATLKNYSYTDSSAMAAVNFYRIMQTDIDGTSLFSKTISVVACGNGNALNVYAYPNPSTGSLKVVFAGDKNQVSKTMVLDLNGKKVYEAAALKSVIDLTNQPVGMYLLQVIANGTIYTTKIMVQK